MLTHLDLCSGIGGFTIAAGWADLETVGFSEIDSYCCALLAEKWPGIVNYGDLRNAASFRGLTNRVTVLSAGVPCQPSSLAGLRRGKNDDRWLWDAVLDVVGCVEPAWAIFENPAGILSLDEFSGVLLRLGALGYQVRAFGVSANSVGARHRRQRMFIVAHSDRDGGQRREEIGAGTLHEAEGPGKNAEPMADTDSERFAKRPECNGESEQSKFESSFGNDSERCSSFAFRITEPPLCGRADGIRGRSHRLKGLGNAVVPQQAYPFFEAIAQAEASFQ